MAENPNPPANLTDKARSIIDTYLSGAKEALDKARIDHDRRYRAWWLKKKGSKLEWNEIYQMQLDERDKLYA
ncbi:hypothetical protein FVEN_g12769 [Fusarium venenatum]|nr:hypothetical protein FVEN_g12769 [Fusarium venenatum]